MLGVVLETTERNRVLEELRTSQERYRAIMETTSDWIWETDAGFRFTYCNQRARDVLGYEPEELLGKTLLDLVVPEDRDAVTRKMTAITSTQLAFSGLETTCLGKDGRHVVVEVNGIPVLDAQGSLTGLHGISRDVTERKRAEAIVQRSEEKYRSLVSNIPDVVWTIDDSLQFVFISPNIERISGFTLEEVQRQGARLYLDCVHPDDVERVRAALQALFARGEAYDVECRVARRNGEWIWVHDRALATYEKDGVRYADGLLSDISERKRAEDAVRRSEELYRTLFEGVSDAILVASLGENWLPGKFLQVNGVACERLGYTREELLRLNVSDINDPDALKSSIPNPSRLRTEKYILFEATHVAKGGRKIPVEISARLIDFQGRPAILAAARDISERKRAEIAIQESEERYRRLLANLPDVVWTSDLHGNTSYISPNVETVFGYTSEEICGGGSELWFGRIHPDDRPAVLEAFSALFTGNRPFNIEYRIQRKSGEWIWLLDRALRAFESGGVRYADGVFSDITTRKQAEQALAESERRYRHLFERNLAGVFRATPDGRYLDCNETCARILGYESREEFLQHRRAEIFFDPADLETTLSRLLAEKSLTDLELRLKCKNGGSAYVLENINLVENECGESHVIEGTFIDITKRKLAEAAVQEGASRFKSIFDSVQTGIVIIDPETHRIVDANPEALRLTGRSHDDVVGAECFQFICPAEKGRCPVTDLGQHVDNSERVMLTASGQRCPIIKTVVPVYISGRRHLLESFVDISDRKRAEEARRKSAEEFKAAFEDAPFGMCLAGLDNQFLRVNHALCQLLGYSKEELLARNWQGLTHPEDVEHSHRAFDELCSGRATSVEFEERYIHKQGNTIWVRMRISAVLDGRGEPSYFITHVEDITERKRTEIELLGAKEAAEAATAPRANSWPT